MAAETGPEQDELSRLRSVRAKDFKILLVAATISIISFLMFYYFPQFNPTGAIAGVTAFLTAFLVIWFGFKTLSDSAEFTEERKHQAEVAADAEL